MVKTSIPKLDDFLGGEIPPGKSLIFYIEPGVEGEVFGLQTIYNAIKSGGLGVFVVSSSSSEDLKSQFKEFGWDIDEYRDRICVVDAYTSLVGAPSDEKYAISNPDNIDNLDKVITDLLKESPPSTMVFGSLSTIMDLCGEKKTIEAVTKWNKLAEKYKHVIVYNFTAWPYSNETLEQMKTHMFNAVITVGGIAERAIFGQYFGVLKSDWTKESWKSMLFRVLRPSGIKIFTPKILVTGPFCTGKSEFMNALSNSAISSMPLISAYSIFLLPLAMVIGTDLTIFFYENFDQMLMRLSYIVVLLVIIGCLSVNSNKKSPYPFNLKPIFG
jgi:KaiC/GvpD/RAD55 family RecA-like ATPase